MMVFFFIDFVLLNIPGTEFGLLLYFPLIPLPLLNSVSDLVFFSFCLHSFTRLYFTDLDLPPLFCIVHITCSIAARVSALGLRICLN